MKNIHILPTDKPSRLFIDIEDNKLKITIPIGGEHMMNQNIYITNDEEIKEGDLFITNNSEIFKCIKNKEEQCFYSVNASILTKFCKKIILTTNTDLIQDGVEVIDDEFLQWFVMNPSCDEVETYSLGIKNEETGESCHYEYEIIIPKVEPKQLNSENFGLPKIGTKEFNNLASGLFGGKPKQETVEEAAEVYANKKGDIPTTKLEDAIFKQGFIDGAKWQQEQDREMEKEKIMDSYVSGLIDPLIMKNYKGLSVDEIRIELKKQAAKYYEETYKNEAK